MILQQKYYRFTDCRCLADDWGDVVSLIILLVFAFGGFFHWMQVLGNIYKIKRNKRNERKRAKNR